MTNHEVFIGESMRVSAGVLKEDRTGYREKIRRIDMRRMPMTMRRFPGLNVQVRYRTFKCGQLNLKECSECGRTNGKVV